MHLIRHMLRSAFESKPVYRHYSWLNQPGRTTEPISIKPAVLRIDLDAELHMNLIQLIDFGSSEVRCLKRASVNV